MAATRRNLSYIFAIIGLLVLPTAFSLSYHAITGNPNLRPLGVTSDSMRAYEAGGAEGVRIVALVDWVPPRTGGYSRNRLDRAITRAFNAKGVEVVVRFKPGEEVTRVSYLVGNSTIGPFSTARAAEGISAAVDAYRMHVPFK
ncbi:hypothetical protein [Maritimibacter sp. UBA3975]|uniref:hypothetical protein n=1 Tax=Maritimibacter sp. UBA3975 TaxID=1946833 RepID=UPI000C0B4D7A|nr:hypothetical protein [Maritimibacter sp. UBA3975]MAM63253.1 hypothetical protein [Maritimibacter sp.]|tara:strand:- start:19521 stop:19949 length:429 start_codon:yes stop_codon:yes gene_type:complete